MRLVFTLLSALAATSVACSMGIHGLGSTLASTRLVQQQGARLARKKEECTLPSATADVALVAAGAKGKGSVAKPPPSDFRTTLAALGPVLASAFCVAAIMYPLDLVRALQMADSGSGAARKTTMQLLSTFKATHGITGFFTQGLAPELARSTWMRFVKFGMYPIFHVALFGIPEKAGTAFTKAVAGVITAIPEAISIMPLEIAKISLQLDTVNKFKNNMLLAMSSAFADKGWAGFTVGYVGVQYRQAAWTAGYFASLKFFETKVNQAFKLAFGPDFDPKSRPATLVLSQLLSGFFAGVFGAALNTPGDTIRTVIQKRILSGGGVSSNAALATSFLAVAQEIYRTRGLGGLYAGFTFKAFHLGGGGALMAFFLPFFKKVFEVPL